jgi:arylsulfatase A-like enzyme
MIRTRSMRRGATSVLAAASLLSGTACRWFAPARPNVILIVVDTLRRDRLPGYGALRDAAPALARLAEQGVLFERVIAPSSWTKTSMASIVTARNPDRHGVRGVEDVLPERFTSLAQAFSAGGYETVGINANPWLRREFGFASGYDVYEVHSFAPARKLNHRARTLIADRSGRPFFLYLHYMDVHAPYLPGAACFGAPPLDVPGFGPMPDKVLEGRYRKDALAAPGVQERVEALYEAEIRCADATIGELLDELRGLGRLDDTIVVVTSDHGEAFREHGTTEHGWNLYPEVYEVPLVIAWPGQLTAGVRVDRQVSSVDLAPTLLELAGLSVPQSFEGRSLLPLEAAGRPDGVAICAVGLNDYVPDRDYVAVVSREHLFIKERRTGAVELYGLRDDPGAQRNLGEQHPAAGPLAALAASAALEKAGTQQLDEETRRQLKALGYLHER